MKLKYRSGFHIVRAGALDIPRCQGRCFAALSIMYTDALEYLTFLYTINYTKTRTKLNHTLNFTQHKYK